MARVAAKRSDIPITFAPPSLFFPPWQGASTFAATQSSSLIDSEIKISKAT